ncbi:hypothetical protein F4776DRAFT_125730 [Hypoxylon sp. NC0597]|nr:hypothetical protein F4776DRAFT_125730 [Hypoxylon sp. NC0597]
MADTPITTGTALLPVEPPPSTPADAVAATNEETRNFPLLTTGTSVPYIQCLAGAVSRASASDPLTVMPQGEKLPPGQSVADLDLASIQSIVYEAALTRLATKLAPGAFIAEAGGFAAVCVLGTGEGGPAVCFSRVGIGAETAVRAVLEGLGRCDAPPLVPDC